MTLTPGWRRFALTLHIVASVGWVGAVAAFLGLAIVGLASPDVQLVRASYLAMDLMYRSVIIPMGLVGLITGVISSLGTDWGLLRYYWVLVKLLLTVPAVGLMLLHIQPVAHMAGEAAAAALSRTDLGGLRIQLVLYSVAATVLLLAVTALSTYKPPGMTPRGARKLRERRMTRRLAGTAATDDQRTERIFN
jgi:hypothetical protein